MYKASLLDSLNDTLISRPSRHINSAGPDPRGLISIQKA